MPTSTSLLPNVLQRQTSLAVGSAVHGEAIEKGRIYVAPPDHHLLVHRGTVHLSRGPKENGHRPAVDTLFRSAARAYGPRVVGAVLSGTLDDGALGLRSIMACGGTGVVQDPADAAFPGMPASALAAVPGAVRAPARELGAIIGQMSRSPVRVEGAEAMADETSTGNEDENSDAWQPINEENAEPSDFTCPECHGTLFRVREGEYADRFRCRVGHGFSTDSLLAGQS